MTDNKKMGNFGERKVRNYLRRRGYVILDKNYLAKCGELDIVARRFNTIAFVEVKTRKEGSLRSGLEAVNRDKKQKIRRTANLYMKRKIVELEPRFDIAEVTVSKRGIFKKVKINYIENAF